MSSRFFIISRFTIYYCLKGGVGYPLLSKCV